MMSGKSILTKSTLLARATESSEFNRAELASYLFLDIIHRVIDEEAAG